MTRAAVLQSRSFVVLVTLAALAVSAPVDWLARGAGRVDISVTALDRPKSGRPEVYLLVGNDRREGLPRGVPAVGELTGQRADSITVWRVDPSGSVRVVALPRDLRVSVPGHGDSKLAGVLPYGPDAVVAATRWLTGAPVNHYVEVDFAAVIEAVQHVGGVDVQLRRPLRDPVVRLALPAGRVHLDGVTALKFIRARQTVEWSDGRWQPAEQGDLARLRRQETLVRALARSVQRPRAALSLLAGLPWLVDGIHLDGSLATGELARTWRTFTDPDTSIVWCTMPSRPAVPPSLASSPFPPAHPGSAGFRTLDEQASAAVSRWFTGEPGASPPSVCDDGRPKR